MDATNRQIDASAANASVANSSVSAPPSNELKPRNSGSTTALTEAQGKLTLLTAERAADTQLAAFIIAALALNLMVLILLRHILASVSLPDALVEKDPAVIEETTAALVASHQADVQAAAALSVAGTPTAAPAPVTAQEVAEALPASYSRIAGAFGAIVLAAALYAIANYIVWAMFFAPDKVSPVLQNIGSFFLAGSALFAPYAFNQLTSIFPAPKKV
ncbi:MAG TPA: hypothetical protein VIT45_14120 [Allosphingosinicella sp.]